MFWYNNTAVTLLIVIQIGFVVTEAYKNSTLCPYPKNKFQINFANIFL